MYQAIESLPRVIALSRITNHVSFAFVPAKWVYSDRLTIFAYSEISDWAVLQSTFHYVWAWHYFTTNLSLLSYSPSQAFHNFPFPRSGTPELRAVQSAAASYYEHRDTWTTINKEGLTPTYNRFHNSAEVTAGIVKLRQLHVEMDRAVASAYGWNDLKLEHGFHETKQGIRYTISEAARLKVLGLLLSLNHERHAEEEAEKLGLAAQSKAPTKRSRKPNPKGVETVVGSFDFEGGGNE